MLEVSVSGLAIDTRNNAPVVILKEVDGERRLEAGGLAVVYFLLGRFLLGFLPLITIQKKINSFWEKKLLAYI